MAGERKITVTFDGKDVGLKKAADKAVDDVKGAGEGISGAFKDIGKTAGGFLVAELTTQLASWAGDGLGWLWDGTKLATDTKESMSKVETIFGDSSGKIKTFAKDAAKNFGLSERAALDASGTFGNMFDQLGFGGNLAADMSTDLIGLSADLASFNNADVTDVIEAQSSAFRGEYDSLQKFIPTINAAAVEQEALALTGKKSAKELTDQEKAMGVFNLMLEGAGKASGDFARTMDSQANQERIAAAEAENLQGSLGNSLLPITQKVTEAKRALVRVLANEVVPWVTETGSKIKEKLQPVWQWLVDHKDEIYGAFSDIGDTIQNKLGPAISDLIDAGKEVTEDIDWQKVWTELKPILEEVGQLLSDLVVAFVTNLAKIISTVASTIREMKRLWDEHATIRTVIREVWDWISTKITTAMNVIQGVIKLVTAIINGDWSGAWKAIKQIASNVWESITADFRAMKNTITSIGSNMWGSMSGSLQSVVDTIARQLNRIIETYNNTVGRIPGVADIPTIGTSSTAGLRKTSKAIPKFASGGIVTRPTLGLIGEAGPEAVVPLNRAGAGFGGGSMHLTIDSGGSALDDLLVEILRKAIRNRGGSVEAVLGR